MTIMVIDETYLEKTFINFHKVWILNLKVGANRQAMLVGSLLMKINQNSASETSHLTLSC